MNLYATRIRAIDPIDGQLKTYSGPNVPGISFSDAETFCQVNGLGYCEVIGRLVAEIPLIKGTYKPDWKNMIDYEKIQLN